MNLNPAHHLTAMIIAADTQTNTDDGIDEFNKIIDLIPASPRRLLAAICVGKIIFGAFAVWTDKRRTQNAMGGESGASWKGMFKSRGFIGAITGAAILSLQDWDGLLVHGFMKLFTIARNYF